MIAANVATAQFLERHGFPSLRRVLRTPERWDRIVELAAGLGERLPAEPSAPALQQFLARRRQADPTRFADVSLSVVKLLGSGEYAVELPGGSADGHFGLAVRDYTHSTAPNRRFPDLATQRLIKAAIAGIPCPYTAERADGAGPPLHAAGGQRHEGGAAGAQVRGGAAARPARRPALRRDRHRRLAEGDLGAHPPPGGGGARGARRARPRRRRPRSAWSWCTPTSSGASSTSPARDGPATGQRRFPLQASVGTKELQARRHFVDSARFPPLGRGWPRAEAADSPGWPVAHRPAWRLQESPVRGAVPAAKASSRSPGDETFELWRNGNP